jgi:outer membrane protein TolC
MPRPLPIALLVLALSGCTPGYYERDAELQVQSLLRDRKRDSLSYEPAVLAENKPTPDAPQRRFERIPVSPVQPATRPALEATPVDVPFGPAGPVNSLAPGQELPPDSDYRSSVRSRNVVDPPVLGPPSPSRRVERHDLFGILRLAVNHSRDYADQMENLYLAALDVTLERHLFSPRPFVTQSLNFDGGQENVNYRSALTATSNAGVRQRLPYGGEVVASTLVRFVDALNDNTQSGESAQLALTASVPLLRGAGMVNLENLIRSERQLVYAVRDFETFRRRFLVDVAQRYFDLLAQRSSVLNRRAQLISRTDLVERSRALFAGGKGSFLDVQRSINSQIQSEISLIQAEESYQAQLDSFKLFLGLSSDVDIELVPIELDASIPEFDVERAVELAEKFRLDVQTARDRIDDARRAVDNSRNGLLPDLDLTAGARTGSNVNSPASQLNNDTSTYNAGVTMELPVDRVAERNAYRRAMIFLQQAQRDYEQSRDNAAVAARNALRRIRSAQDRVELSRRNVQISQARLDLANQLLRQPLLNAQGLTSSNRDVVEAQQELLAAQDALDSARATLQIQVLAYYRDTGTLRIDPESGNLGRAMHRQSRDARQ